MLYEILGNIQARISVPKDNYNAFGGFKYRTVDGILTQLKPLLKEHNACVMFEDEIVMVGERYYIKATCTLHTEHGEISKSAFAREAKDKGKMDDAQITGAASSYARKYALCALFLIDSGEDVDKEENEKNNDVVTMGGRDKSYNKQSYTNKSNKLVTDAQINRLYAKANEFGFDEEALKKSLEKKGKTDFKQLTMLEYDNMIAGMEKAAKDRVRKNDNN